MRTEGRTDGRKHVTKLTLLLAISRKIYKYILNVKELTKSEHSHSAVTGRVWSKLPVYLLHLPHKSRLRHIPLTCLNYSTKAQHQHIAYLFALLRFLFSVPYCIVCGTVRGSSTVNADDTHRTVYWAGIYILTYLLHGAGSFLSSWLVCS